MVEMTAEEVLKQLEHSWINERNAPDLLEPRTEVNIHFYEYDDNKTHKSHPLPLFWRQ